MIEPLQLRARGLVFDALAAGPATGEPVVLLHGFPQTSACWTRVLEALAAAGYRAVAPDQRGYSPTARPNAVRAYRMPELVADVVAIADGLGATRVHLVGHDWGGAVAWNLAGRHPERVATLTAVSTPHPGAFARALTTGTQPLRSAYIPLFRTPRLPELLLGAYRQWCPGAAGCAVGGAGVVPSGHAVQPADPAGARADAVRLGLGRSGAGSQRGNQDGALGQRRLPVRGPTRRRPLAARAPP
jgi:pimeloyl-ACP methyl ester carboxylesterase